MRQLAAVLALLALGGVVSCAEDDPVSPPTNASASGVVLDRTGAPVPEVVVSYWLLPLSPSLPHPYQVGTDQDGSYSLNVPPGHYRVEMSAPKTLGYPGFGTYVDLKSGSNKLDHRYSGTLVRGAGVGPDGLGLSSFRVIAESKQFQGTVESFGSYGEYRLLLKPGPYILHGIPERDGLPHFHIETEVSATDTTIDLSFTGNQIDLRASVLGIPLSGVEVSTWSLDAGASTRTDVQGDARMYLPSGAYDLTIQTPEGMTGPEVRKLDVQGNLSQVIDLSAVRWTVTVRRAGSPEPVYPAYVNIRELGTIRGGSTQLDENGTFEMLVRPNAPHEIAVGLFGSSTSDVVSVASSGEDATFEIVVDLPPTP